MAAVGALMDDSYADRAKKATIASTLRNNAKQLLSQPTLEASGAPGAISSSTSDTLDSSPALSTSQTPATSLIMPNSVPMSSASSDQASPARPAPSLSPANVWSQQSPWKTPTKQPPASNLPTPITNFDKHNPPSELSPFSVRSELHPSSLKAASRPSQRNVDPFVVNYSLNAPSLADASNWPQVGESTAPQHRARPSASSTSSTIIISTPQAPMKPAYDTESELSPSKKAKGEKTKWVPIPPKELQAAVDEVTRQHHGGSNSKSHSPRVNGRGRRLNEDTSDSKQSSKPASRGESRSSPVRAANTRHDRNPSLTVPSAGSSRRVSPLHMTSSLPSPSSNLVLEHTPDSPSHHRLPSPSIAPAIAQTQTIAENQAMQNDRSEASVPAQAPFYSTHSRNPSQTVHPTVPVMAYPPMWAPPVYPVPYHPPYSSYQPSDKSKSSPKETAIEIQRSPRIRQKRKRRPTPSEAPAVAGYRTTVPEVLHEVPAIGVEFGNNASIDVDELVSKAERPVVGPSTRTRTTWWSYGLSDRQIERWLRRDPDLLEPEVKAETLCKDSGIIFGISSNTSPIVTAESPVQNAILQNNQFGSHQVHPSDPATGYPTWPAPGAGPSSLDIGLAMGIPASHPHHMPTPLYMGMPPPPASHLPSPVSAVSRPDWSGRDEPFTPMPPQTPMYPYAPYPYQSMNGYPGPNYNMDTPAIRNAYGSEGRGRSWRDDRYTPRGGGRGRGYPSRGRGFRGGYGGPRSSNSQYGSPGGIPQSPYPPSPSQPLSNTTTVYIPDPVLHQPMYPYNPIIPPPPFTGYRPSGQTAQEPSANAQGRPPSPKPMTQLTVSLEPTRFKLLGQIEYYFSHENVAKDMYLREKMDSKGWVSLQILQSFPRIQNLKVSDELIHETLQWSQYVEVRQNHVRMAQNEWRHYVRQDATESTVSDIPDPAWYPAPIFYSGYPGAGMPPMYPPHPYAYYPPPPQANPYALSNGIADHILRRPEERMSNGNGVLESGTSVGESFDSTPHTTEGEDAETSEDDVVFLIGDPSPMTRPTNTQTTGEQVVKKMTL